jgi:uncharacterized protein DUF1937
MSYWYLGSPYGNYPQGHSAAHNDIVAQAALLVGAGVEIFCPIAHTHNIAQHMAKNGIPIPDPHRFWLDLDRPLMEAARGLIVCKLESWETSRGLQEEFEYFKKAHKPIVFMIPGVIPIELTAERIDQ